MTQEFNWMFTFDPGCIVVLIALRIQQDSTFQCNKKYFSIHLLIETLPGFEFEWRRQWVSFWGIQWPSGMCFGYFFFRSLDFAILFRINERRTQFVLILNTVSIMHITQSCWCYWFWSATTNVNARCNCTACGPAESPRRRNWGRSTNTFEATSGLLVQSCMACWNTEYSKHNAYCAILVMLLILICHRRIAISLLCRVWVLRRCWLWLQRHPWQQHALHARRPRIWWFHQDHHSDGCHWMWTSRSIGRIKTRSFAKQTLMLTIIQLMRSTCAVDMYGRVSRRMAILSTSHQMWWKNVELFCADRFVPFVIQIDSCNLFWQVDCWCAWPCGFWRFSYVWNLKEPPLLALHCGAMESRKNVRRNQISLETICWACSCFGVAFQLSWRRNGVNEVPQVWIVGIFSLV